MHTSYLDKITIYYSGIAGRDFRDSWELGLTFYDILLTQYSLFIPTRVAHLNFRVPYGELELFTYEGIQAHCIPILNRLSRIA
jgi:hypothetical protein